jgi:hypothetical protein
MWMWMSGRVEMRRGREKIRRDIGRNQYTISAILKNNSSSDV